jgi:Fur family ferric uptake transcriptional regulator
MLKKDAEKVRIVEKLRAHDFRITDGRIQLLELLYAAHKPLSIQHIREQWQGAVVPNQTTLYRTLADFAETGIVRRVDFNSGTAHFEYTPDHPHHHHLICNDCGTIEDIDNCPTAALQKNLLKTSKHFKNIYSHTLEFFGQCTRCATA